MIEMLWVSQETVPYCYYNFRIMNNKWFVLTVLTLIYVFNFADRQILIILQESIKEDLQLSDTQLGLLTGLGFALLYTTLGIPLAKLADKYNRKNILVFSLGFWSLMTVMSGRALSFFQLLLTRIGVSAGEAGGMPPSHSIISDYFPKEQRGTAFSIYSMGIPIGILLGFIVAGSIASEHGWRIAFYALGIPGVLLSILLYFILKEPIRGHIDGHVDYIKDATFKEAIRALFAKKSFLYLCLGAGFTTFSSYSLNNFLPSFIQRAHGVDLITVSINLGLSIGIGGLIGALIGGRLADIKGAKNKKWYLYVPILSCIFSLFPAIIILFTGNPKIALAAIFPYAMFNAAFTGPVYAVGQTLANVKMRAFATALILLFMNGIGLALGPLSAGILSDFLEPTLGNFSLRYALTLNLLSLFIAIFFYWKSANSYEKDLEKL